MTTLERPFAVKVARVINKYAKKASQDAESIGKNLNVDLSLEGMASDLEKLYIPHYKRTAKVFGGRILKGLKSNMIELETKNEDEFLEGINDWISDTAGDRVVMVTDTTKNSIRRAIEESVEESLVPSDMAKLIYEKTGGAIARTRAVTIARTETHMASQASSIRSAEASGLKLKKVWIASEDEATRDSHTQADHDSHENPLNMNDEFQVGGDSMTACGLGSDPAENINCRCVLGYRSALL